MTSPLGLKEKCVSPLPTTIIQPTNESRKPGLNVHACYVVIGLVGALVLTGVILGTYHLGQQTCMNNYKQAWLTFRTTKTAPVIKERVVVQNKEVEVSRPGLIRIVIDYQRNIFVMQYDQELKGNELNSCYVYEFPNGMFGSEKDTELAILEKDTIKEDLDEMVLEFDATQEEFPRNLLSPKAKDMCFGVQIMKAVERKREGHIKKREAAICHDTYSLCAFMEVLCCISVIVGG